MCKVNLPLCDFAAPYVTWFPLAPGWARRRLGWSLGTPCRSSVGTWAVPRMPTRHGWPPPDRKATVAGQNKTRKHPNIESPRPWTARPRRANPGRLCRGPGEVRPRQVLPGRRRPRAGRAQPGRRHPWAGRSCLGQSDVQWRDGVATPVWRGVRWCGGGWRLGGGRRWGEGRRRGAGRQC